MHVGQPAMSGDSANFNAIAKLMLSFIDRIRIAAAHDTACEPGENPLQRAHERCVSKLSDEERVELVRIMNKLSQQLEEQEPSHRRKFLTGSAYAEQSLEFPIGTGALLSELKQRPPARDSSTN
jgi:hypothetical protein